ncbi:MAG TPA: Crp/Fnr family transcriptional regulator [Dissulfurispiraceae bacterium]|nr:Crp/Fnr family transcriptional regulator [Dissulfurispiraceae bacterium]
MKEISNNEFAGIFPAFRNSPALVSEILSVSNHKPIPKDVRIYSEGDACSAIALVISGEIRVFKIGENGREITLYEIEQGETCILNASCILSNMSYPAHAVTMLDSELLLVPAGEFRRLLERSEVMRNFVFNLLSRRLTSVMALVEEVAFGRMDSRLLDYIEEKAEDGQLNTTHQKIANDLGTSREVVSRLLKDFERRGKIILTRNLIRMVNK